MRTCYALIILLGLLGLSPVTLAQGFEGYWKTGFGDVHLYEDYEGTGRENIVYGTYGERGFIVGKSNGQTLRGVFVYADQTTGRIDTDRARNFGTFEWNLTADFKRFNGPWTWGKEVPNGSGQGWSGTLESEDLPQIDRSKLRKWSFWYALQAGKTVNAWMRAVRDLDGAGYVDPDSFGLGDFDISVVSGGEGAPPTLSRAEQDATAKVKRANPGLYETCWIVNVEASTLRCDLRQPLFTVKGVAGMETVLSSDAYPDDKRLLLDLRNCLPGTAKVDGFYLVCESSAYSGSFTQSCDPLRIEAGSSSFEYRFVSYCDGPSHRLPRGFEQQTLFNEKGKTVTYYRYPTLVEHASSDDRPYKSALSDAYDCASKRLWNNNGYLNSSR